MYGEVLAESGVRDRLPWLDMRGNHGQSVCYSQIMGVSTYFSSSDDFDVEYRSHSSNIYL